MCVLTNERYKICQMGFSFCHLGYALGAGLGVLRGQKLNSCSQTVMVYPPKPLDQIQPNLVCELLAQRQTLFGPAPPEDGSKGQISFNFNFKGNFKDFYTKLCACSHK